MDKFDKCSHCGTWHEIKVVDWGGIPIESCPHIPNDVFMMCVPADPDHDSAISASHRGSA